ncbi:sulfur carrier protein ThiS [Intrasporangium calvum]|uniref:Sulfur carrier protein ThiS n=1 Tax=Intrasporangium calvum TaxID=53358 RepID=A0ABT5GLQ8_9MICO|nr:sulfur carrier protein ThiS [Intrasporangium calvum]MDC5699162.1 sulfur carrier protein ThiS [Intrasporangium calvum]
MNVIVNGEERLVPPDTTVAGLVAALDLPSRGIAIALDRVIVPRSLWASERLSPGAEVEIVTAMQGG